MKTLLENNADCSAKDNVLLVAIPNMFEYADIYHVTWTRVRVLGVACAGARLNA